MILVEIRYEIHDDKFLAKIETFKILHYYLEGCKHKVLIFTDYNNPRQFMDIKSMSFC